MKLFKNVCLCVGVIIVGWLIMAVPLLAATKLTPKPLPVAAAEVVIPGKKIEFMSTNTALFNQLISKQGVTPQQIWGYLNMPVVRGGRKVPAIIMLPGSGGIEAWTSKYVKALNALGVATFQVDSFAPRGVKQTITDQSKLPVPMLIGDAYAALSFVAQQPNIDPKRIAVMGWSLGGLVSLATAFEDISVPQLGKDGPRFAAHITFYPACNLDYPNKHLDGAPWLYLHGGADDYTQVSDCLTLIGQVSNEVLVKAVIYPDAYHAFDEPVPVQWLPTAQNPEHCRGRLSADWVATEEKTGIVLKTQADFQKAYAGCMISGAHLGYNQPASDDAMYEVTDFVQHYLMNQTPYSMSKE